MGLGVLIAVIGIIIFGFLASKNDAVLGIWALLMVVALALGGAVYALPLYPDYQKAPYSVTVRGEELYFSDYTRDTNLLIITQRYYKKSGFINSWELCPDVTRVAIPEGYNLIVTNRTPAAAPYIIGDTCK